jgi:hypothetical protein
MYGIPHLYALISPITSHLNYLDIEQHVARATKGVFELISCYFCVKPEASRSMDNKISYDVIKRITNNYDKGNILGSGGFGTVYKVCMYMYKTFCLVIYNPWKSDFVIAYVTDLSVIYLLGTKEDILLSEIDQPFL